MSTQIVPLESILRTEELWNRPARAPNYEKENRALVRLSQALADAPRTVLQTLVDTILEVCEAGSAGISLLTMEDSEERFYWPAIAGQWKPHIGGGTPRNFGPCGDVLDRNTPLLFTHVERRYEYFQVQPPLEEALLIPFYVEGEAVGTLWAVAHDDHRRFDAEDERMMVSLGKFASSAYQVLESLRAIKFEIVKREKVEVSLHQSGLALQRSRLAEQQAKRVRELSHLLMKVQEEERRHIARELHDSAGQILAALGMHLAAGVRRARQHDPELAKNVEAAEELVRELTQEIRTTSYLLHPPLLDEGGLSEALPWYIAGLQDRSSMQITLDFPRNLGRLSSEMEMVIFRTVQECLTNIHRHSGSKSAAIRVARSPHFVALEIQDEGKGMSPELLIQLGSHGGGVGIRGIRERVFHLGGELMFVSDGNGTTVSVRFPLAQATD